LTDPVRSVLQASGQTTLNASGAGTVTLGPDASRGPAHWHVTGVIVQTSRPGVSPIPRAQVYLDRAEPGRSQGLTYDGSYDQGACDIDIQRGTLLVAAWTGGQSGDIAYLTVTGEKW
jgi:hypothetical protein